MNKELFGILPDGTEISRYWLESCVCRVGILDLGGIITDFNFRDKSIVCGFDTLDDYLRDNSYQGAIIGRYANRIANAAFTIGEHRYTVGANEGKHSLHGGHIGFNRRRFTVTAATNTTLTLTLFSPDGEEGYPGNLSVTVTYCLNGSSLTISYTAVTDKDTPVNLTNHSYFNLKGAGHSVFDTEAMICAEHYTEVDEELIPTGKHPAVAGTPYDLRTPTPIGKKPDGFDHNFVLKKPIDSTDTVPLAATMVGGGLRLSVYTTAPCLQFYTACVLVGTPCFRGGVPKRPYTAFCLEPQEEPNSPNNGKAILQKGETYRHTTIYQIETEA